MFRLFILGDVMTDRQPVLSVQGLHVYYGASHALQGVDLQITEGVGAVLGRNGMGKTTLCNAIMGLVPIKSGSIRFDGRELSSLSSNRIANLGIGFVPQGRRLWESLTVDEHLRLCAVQTSAWSIDRIYEMFPRLAERRHNGGAELSGGEQQMLAIARSLLPGPRLLVMDEPTEGLAPVIVDQVIDLLRRLDEEKQVAVLLVEQNISVAVSVSRTVSIMINGRISTTLPSSRLAGDRDLQQRLLGVGRALDSDSGESEVLDEGVASESDVSVGALPDNSASGHDTDVSEDSSVLLTESESSEGRASSLNDYVPPPRWSSERWSSPSKASKDSDVGLSPAGSVSASSSTLRRHIIDEHIIVAGTFDTKGVELTYIRDRLTAQNLRVRTVDLSTSGTMSSADVPPHHVASYHPDGVQSVLTGDRGSSVSAMSDAFRLWIESLSGVAGIISAGGSGATALVTPAMRSLPVGVPKLMISTVASGDVGQYVGPSDIMMMYSVTDIQGLNRISADVLATGSDALAGAVRFGRLNPHNFVSSNPSLGLTMFGVTTTAVQNLMSLLSSSYDCLVFHATGVGGQSMEKLVSEGVLSSVMDVTTTEVCDLLMGGVFPATEDRFGVFSRLSVPYVGSVGALDMVNWRAPDTVPERYKDRLFYEHNPQITLMRTTVEENVRMGRWIVERLNRMRGPVRFILPLGGVSSLDAVDQPFYSPDADSALFDAIRSGFEETSTRKLIMCDAHINDREFAEVAVSSLEEIT